ncbi:septation protein A [Comamonas badia]|uniref:septation protein A n=1 Tax=Comamonas badia TaxID=265291 RepID=UPI00041B745C|nr:septation protein A [Comamonas badia]
MRLLLDFVPILLFFIAYKWHGIYAGTAVLMAATCVQMAIVWWLDRKLSTMHKATLVLILLFGALTLVLQDERFIKWKPTVLYAAMALALAIALWVYHKNFLKIMLGSQIALPEAIWGHLSVAWIGYCLFMAALNGYVAAYFSTDAWMDFKLWGYVFPVVFIIGQGLYIARHMSESPEVPSPGASE